MKVLEILVIVACATAALWYGDGLTMSWNSRPPKENICEKPFVELGSVCVIGYKRWNN